MPEDPTAVKNSPEIAHTDVNKNFWARTPFESKLAIAALVVTTLLTLPGTIQNFQAIGDGPIVTVSSASGPFESPKMLNDSELDGMTWFSRVKIGNVGNQPATQVAIPWETGGYARIIDINGESKSFPFNKRLELGELPRDATIEVSLWTEETFSSESSQIPKISHSTGSVRIFERPPLPWYLSPANYFYWFTISFAIFCMWFVQYNFKRSYDRIWENNDEFIDNVRKENETFIEKLIADYEKSVDEAVNRLSENTNVDNEATEVLRSMRRKYDEKGTSELT